MNRIDKQFAELREKGEKALVGFVLAGDPSFDRSLELLAAMCDAGLDVLELGVPFSDPTADGPVIQRGGLRALKSGSSLAGAIRMIGALRKKTDVPVVLFSYYNPIFAYGLEAFFRDAPAAGADGMLVVDLPPEEAAEMNEYLPDGNDFALIRLVAPTTPPERMHAIVKNASGFIYLISKAGVTGGGGLDPEGIRKQAATLRAASGLPLCVGFGVSTPDDAAMLAPFVDGVVIGSTFENIIEEYRDSPDLAERLAGQVRSFKAAMRETAAMNSHKTGRMGG
ncbi:MAG TPA: tryptophan synthase subunit alpha [Deltaproteobacteria bacterium]|nr:tryptophan synthase subunit alpha [Deltaproteobacteria bacterium]